ncbi:MAG TPA: hypothetical protein VH299_15450 [Solirubrobacterales bacterium]|nr:hypothetical protein [Solirubrobacterales bacterium]
MIAAAIALGGCGGGSTATNPSSGQNAPLGAHKDNPTQERLAKDNPTQVPLSKDNPTQVPLSAETDGKGAGS